MAGVRAGRTLTWDIGAQILSVGGDGRGPPAAVPLQRLGGRRTAVSAVSSRSGTRTGAVDSPGPMRLPFPSSPKHLPLFLSLHTPCLRKTTPSPSSSSPQGHTASFPTSRHKQASSSDFSARTKSQKPEKGAPPRLKKCNPSSLSDKSFPGRNVTVVREGSRNQRPPCQCPTAIRENQGNAARSSFWPRAADQIKQWAATQHAIPSVREAYWAILGPPGEPLTCLASEEPSEARQGLRHLCVLP